VSPDIVFWLAIVGLAAVFVAAVGARSLTDFSRHELEEICRHRKPDRLGQILVRHDEAALAAEMLQVIAVAAAIGAGTCWVWLAYRPETVAPWLLVAASVGGGAAGRRGGGWRAAATTADPAGSAACRVNPGR